MHHPGILGFESQGSPGAQEGEPSTLSLSVKSGGPYSHVTQPDPHDGGSELHRLPLSGRGSEWLTLRALSP